MPTPLNIELLFTEGKKKVKVAEERRYLMGGAEGPWWFKFSWWVIPLGLTLLITPWLFLAGSCGSPLKNLSSVPPIFTKEDETIFRSTIVLPETEGETDDEETHRSTIHLPE